METNAEATPAPAPAADQKPQKPKLSLVLYPDAKLTNSNAPITEYTPEMAEKVKDMFELMYATDGVGLAAPQIGWNVQLFVLNLTPKDKTKQQVFWNPKVKNSGGWIDDIEGCLSFPGVFSKIKRYASTHLSAMTPEGPVELDFEDIGARAIQHEIDHLEGFLFIERMTPADQRKNLAMLKMLRYRHAAEIEALKEKEAKEAAKAQNVK